MLADRPQSTAQDGGLPLTPANSCFSVSQREFVAELQSAGLARHWVRGVLEEHSWTAATPAVDDLVVIVSELVTNVVLHASVPGKDVLVRLRRVEDRCRIEVLDGRPDLLPPTDLHPSEERGRGLLLVRGLSADMGVERSGGDKVVWAEVHPQGPFGAAA
ncbi:ATP-binding protein [Kitasatospora sp. NPDC004615]|uniref:ATP-binding protein n=1 Tax=Kitasatospora sp. NPDC004615 TaxID=3364017 RepID=UPI0036B63772